MGFTPTETIWFNGALVPWGDAKVHVLAHGLHYGTGVFEGMRCYLTSDGPAVFRLDAHLERFYQSAARLRVADPVFDRPALRRDARADSREQDGERLPAADRLF